VLRLIPPVDSRNILQIRRWRHLDACRSTGSPSNFWKSVLP